MFARRCYVSLTRADGRFLSREMLRADQAIARMTAFDWSGETARGAASPVMAVQSQHDGRLTLRLKGEAFAVEIVGEAPRKAAMFGLLPARDGFVRSETMTMAQAQTAITALYTLSQRAWAAYWRTS